MIRIEPDWKKLSDIRVVSFDVDGVLTDGKLYWGKSGLENLNFNVKDGSAIKLLMNSGYTVVICSSNNSEIIKNRMMSLGIEYIFTGVTNKLKTMQNFCLKNGYHLANVLHVGDDTNDHELLQKVGVSACPYDAIPEIKEIVDLVLSCKGGSGVARSLISMLLREPQISNVD